MYFNSRYGKEGGSPLAHGLGLAEARQGHWGAHLCLGVEGGGQEVAVLGIVCGLSSYLHGCSRGEYCHQQGYQHPLGTIGWSSSSISNHNKYLKTQNSSNFKTPCLWLTQNHSDPFKKPPE